MGRCRCLLSPAAPAPHRNGNGGIGDSLSGHSGYTFSTYDSERSCSCATSYTGAWWYTCCHTRCACRRPPAMRTEMTDASVTSNLNGQNYQAAACPWYARCMIWNSWRGYYYDYYNVEMKVRTYLRNFGENCPAVPPPLRAPS